MSAAKCRALLDVGVGFLFMSAFWIPMILLSFGAETIQWAIGAYVMIGLFVASVVSWSLWRPDAEETS